MKRFLVPFAAACAFAAAASAEPAAVAPSAQAAPAASLSQRLASGAHYVIVTRRELFPLRSEGRNPGDAWFTIDGYFVPESGTWTSNATGFPTPGTPWHSCPAETQCGGIHEAGMVLDRWYRPEAHEIVAIGQKLTFDDDGACSTAAARSG